MKKRSQNLAELRHVLTQRNDLVNDEELNMCISTRLEGFFQTRETLVKLEYKQQEWAAFMSTTADWSSRYLLLCVTVY